MTPSVGEIRAALDRILSSQCFEQAGRSKEFLQFVVQESLAGRSGALKGYSIARAVFGKPADFDAQSDPLVRVEAGRLRRRLVRYYGEEGKDDALRITLPRGSYAPEFSLLEPMPAATVRRGKGKILAAAIGLAAVGALLAAVLVNLPGRERPVAPGESGPTAAVRPGPRMPRILVVPFENVGDADFGYFAFGLTEEVIVRLNAFDFFVIANHTGYESDAEPIAAVSSEVQADYLLTGSVRHDGQRIRVAARLIDARSGEQLWVRSYDELLALDTVLSIQERISREVATTLGEPLGPLYDEEFARSTSREPADFDTYDCVLRFYYYAQTLDRDVHRMTVGCLQRTLARDPSNAVAWGALAILYRHEYMYGYTPQADGGASLDRALEAARTSLDIDGGSAMGTLALALTRQAKGDIGGFKESVDRLLAAGLPPTGEIQVGSSLILSGERERGLAVLEAALKRSPRPPGWSYEGYVAYYLEDAEYDQAFQWAKRIDMPRWFGDPMYVAATAALAGDEHLAKRAAARLLALFPDFPHVGRELLRHWSFDDTVYSRMVAGLERAGLVLD